MTLAQLWHRPVHLFICLLLVGGPACGSQPDEAAVGGGEQAASNSDTTEARAAPGPSEEAPDAAAVAGQEPGAVPGDDESSTPTSGPASTAVPASGPMLLHPPATGSYVYVRDSGSDTDERTEKYEQVQKGDDHVVMSRQFQFADVTFLNVEAWANSRAGSPGVYWIQTRVPGVSSDWCKWPADDRPKLLPGDLSKPQTLNVDSTCTIGPGETMSIKGVVEVKGRSGSTDKSSVDTKLTVSYRDPAQSATREVQWTALISPSEGLVTEASGSYSGTDLSRKEFRDRLKR